MPSIATQKKIASVFNALDDKIALNNKINDNLEQQAQTLYRKYFSEAGNTGELADVCDFSKDKIAVSELSVGNYFSTENMLPDKREQLKLQIFRQFNRQQLVIVVMCWFQISGHTSKDFILPA